MSQNIESIVLCHQLMRTKNYKSTNYDCYEFVKIVSSGIIFLRVTQQLYWSRLEVFWVKKMKFADLCFLVFGTIGLMFGGKGYFASAICIILSAIIFVVSRKKKEIL